MRGVGQAMADGNQTKLLNQLKTPSHSNPYSQPCERKMFVASFVPQPTLAVVVIEI